MKSHHDIVSLKVLLLEVGINEWLRDCRMSLRKGFLYGSMLLQPFGRDFMIAPHTHRHKRINLPYDNMI